MKMQRPFLSAFGIEQMPGRARHAVLTLQTRGIARFGSSIATTAEVLVSLPQRVRDAYALANPSIQGQAYRTSPGKVLERFHHDVVNPLWATQRGEETPGVWGEVTETDVDQYIRSLGLQLREYAAIEAAAKEVDLISITSEQLSLLNVLEHGKKRVDLRRLEELTIKNTALFSSVFAPYPIGTGDTWKNGAALLLGFQRMVSHDSVRREGGAISAEAQLAQQRAVGWWEIYGRLFPRADGYDASLFGLRKFFEGDYTDAISSFDYAAGAFVRAREKDLATLLKIFGARTFLAQGDRFLTEGDYVGSLDAVTKGAQRFTDLGMRMERDDALQRSGFIQMMSATRATERGATTLAQRHLTQAYTIFEHLGNLDSLAEVSDQQFRLHSESAPTVIVSSASLPPPQR